MSAKRKNYEIVTGIQETLEKHGRLNLDYGKPVGDYEMPDKNYKYRQTGIHKVIWAFWMTVMAAVAPIVLKIHYGAKVTGKENLKALKGKGAICVCNHISYLDTLFVRQALGYYRTYHTTAPFNNKSGLGGHIVKHGGTLPFSSDLGAVRNLNAEMERLVKSGKIVNFYAEESLWGGYRKPRPMKIGAFRYATKYDVPVIPVFCTFERTKKNRIKKLRINILPPVYGDENLPPKLRSQKMKDEAEASWQECYEKCYAKTKTTTEVTYECNDAMCERQYIGGNAECCNRKEKA